MRSSADGRPDAFNLGSLRTELHMPSAFHTAHSIEECAESDDDEEEADDEEDDMVLGSTPQVRPAQPNKGQSLSSPRQHLVAVQHCMQSR